MTPPHPDLLTSPSQNTSSITFSQRPALNLQPELESTSSEYLKYGELLEDDKSLNSITYCVLGMGDRRMKKTRSPPSVSMQKTEVGQIIPSVGSTVQEAYLQKRILPDSKASPKRWKLR